MRAHPRSHAVVVAQGRGFAAALRVALVSTPTTRIVLLNARGRRVTLHGMFRLRTHL